MMALRSRVGTAATGSARTPPRRGRGVAGEFLGSGSLGQPLHDEGAPCICAHAAPLSGFASRLNERDDSLIIHGHGGRDERELPDALLAL